MTVGELISHLENIKDKNLTVYMYAALGWSNIRDIQEREISKLDIDDEEMKGNEDLFLRAITLW
jgi:hypothetical protein